MSQFLLCHSYLCCRCQPKICFPVSNVRCANTLLNCVQTALESSRACKGSKVAVFIEKLQRIRRTTPICIIYDRNTRLALSPYKLAYTRSTLTESNINLHYVIMGNFHVMGNFFIMGNFPPTSESNNYGNMIPRFPRSYRYFVYMVRIRQYRYIYFLATIFSSLNQLLYREDKGKLIYQTRFCFVAALP